MEQAGRLRFSCGSHWADRQSDASITARSTRRRLRPQSVQSIGEYPARLMRVKEEWRFQCNPWLEKDRNMAYQKWRLAAAIVLLTSLERN